MYDLVASLLTLCCPYFCLCILAYSMSISLPTSYHQLV